MPAGWELVPLVKVGRDLAAESQAFLRTLNRATPGARCVEVPSANNRVVLHYQNAERRCERMSGGVPGWTWPELGPLVADLDAIYVNFISGFEMGLGTAQALRQAFPGSIYADLHSLFLGMRQDGMRMLQPLPDAPSWFGCFDVVQMNEEEMRQLTDEPLAAAAAVLGAGARTLIVTLGPRGAVYLTEGSTEGRKDGTTESDPDPQTVRRSVIPSFRPAVTELIPRRGSTPPIPPAAATSSARPVAPGCSAVTRWRRR